MKHTLSFVVYLFPILSLISGSCRPLRSNMRRAYCHEFVKPSDVSPSNTYAIVRNITDSDSGAVILAALDSCKKQYCITTDGDAMDSLKLKDDVLKDNGLRWQFPEPIPSNKEDDSGKMRNMAHNQLLGFEDNWDKKENPSIVTTGGRFGHFYAVAEGEDDIVIYMPNKTALGELVSDPPTPWHWKLIKTTERT